MSRKRVLSMNEEEQKHSGNEQEVFENHTSSQNEAVNNQNENASQDNSGMNQTQGTQSESGQNGRNEDSGQYNFKTPQYGRGESYGHDNGGNQNAGNGNYSNNGQPPFGPQKPRKHSNIGKELGIFAAKAAIGAVIGVAVLALAGTIALNATNKNVYIVDKNKQVTIGESGSGNSSFPFGSFGFGGQGNSEGNDGSGNDDNGSNNDNDNEEQQSDNDGPKLGVKVESMPDKLAEAGYPEGVLVAEVTKGGAADKAGIKTGDVITAFNGTVVKSVDELVEQVQSVKAGDTVKLNYKRMENGTFKAYDADVTFSDQTDSSASDSEGETSDSSDSETESSESSSESGSD